MSGDEYRGRGGAQTMNTRKVVVLLASSSGVQSILLQVQTLAEVDVPLVRDVSALELLVYRNEREHLGIPVAALSAR